MKKSKLRRWKIIYPVSLSEKGSSLVLEIVREQLRPNNQQPHGDRRRSEAPSTLLVLESFM